ncbi:MAG: GNAT family N-acetyltransferase [Ruminococcaceae bacterium]|nr:GNAT family N-acetyltransferase [Oscillospiraceae bacterium]
MTVCATEQCHLSAVTELAMLIWGGSSDELRGEFAAMLSDESRLLLVAVHQGEVVGFAQAGLRHDYVEGTGTSPVGYLEGVCVREDFRHRGCAAALVAQCEQWARERGCSEFASDCELDNTASLAFHLGIGFEEAGRIICFKKSL